MKPVPKLFRNLTQTVGASGVQFLITLIATPIMTRLYEPASYAAFGIIYTTATAIVGVGLLSLPNAYPLEKDADERVKLLHTMLRILGILALAATIVSIGMPHLLDVGRAATALLPILVVTFGLRQILVSLATTHQQFARLALGQVVEPICSRGGSIALGVALGGHPAYILASVAVGNIAASAIIFRRVRLEILAVVHTLFRVVVHPFAVLQRHRDFVRFNTASQQAQPLVMLGIQMALAALFSSHAAGQYILATSILSLPVSLIALATAPVTYRHFIEISRTAPAELWAHFRRALVLYLLAGIAILSPLLFFGEILFTVAFSAVWAEAGRIAGTLCMAYASLFAVVGVQSIFRVTGHLKWQFLMDISFCILLLLGAMVCFAFVGFQHAMIGLLLLLSLRNIAILASATLCAFQYAHAAKGSAS